MLLLVLGSGNNAIPKQPVICIHVLMALSLRSFVEVHTVVESCF